MKLLKLLLPILLLNLVISIANPLQAQMPYELDYTLEYSGFNSPVDIAHANDGRLFVVERSGRIKIIDANGNTLSMPFLDIDDRVHDAGNQSEQGLLGLTFHPDYQDNGYFYLHYIANNDDSVIARFSVNGNNPNLANPNSEMMLMVIDQPYTNHNGGTLKFGPDGYLYIGMGDGGSANDPENRAQNTQSMHGKMLRIDVDNGNPYSIPSTNPFTSTINVLDEIWAIGLRNPWKFSFDRQTGDLWIGDVGQRDWEEINYQPYFSTGGENYGWRCWEGNHPFNMNGCNATYTPPIAEYSHDGFEHCSITGGYVYRGPVSGFANYGIYLYADYCSGRVQGTWYDSNLNVNTITFKDFPGNPTTFGEDAEGNMYVASLASGQIYKIDISCTPGQNCPLSVVVTQIINASCNGYFDGAASIQVQDGNAPYDYDWPDGQNGPTATGLTAFTYTVTVTDASNNTGTATVTIGEPDPIEIIVEEQEDITCTSLGGALIAINGDYPPFQTAWPDGNMTISNFNITSPGIYTVTVTDNNNCTATLDVEIEGSMDVPNFSLDSSNDLSCANSCTTLSANLENPNGNYLYQWTLPNGQSGGNNATLEVCLAGIYDLTIIDNDTDCSRNESIEIQTFTNNLEITDLTQTTVLNCNQTEVLLEVGSTESNLTFQWSDQGATTGPELIVTTAGMYTVIATSLVTGCTASQSFEVTVDQQIPTATASADGILTCETATVMLLGSSTTQANLSFEWSTTDGNIVSGANSENALVDQVGLYQLTVTNLDNGCLVQSYVSVIEDFESPSVSITASSASFDCDQSDIVLEGLINTTLPNNAFVFTWMDNTNAVISSTPTVTINQAGTYTLSVVNSANGCESTSSIAIGQSEVPNLSVGPPAIITCDNPEVTLFAETDSDSQTLIFVWTGPDGFTAQSQNVLVSEPGVYTVKLTDSSNNCEVEESVIVDEDLNLPSFSISSSGALNCVFAEVVLTAITTNMEVVTWTLPSGETQTGNVILVTQAGTYCAEIIDPQNGCVIQSCIEVIEDYFPQLPDVVLPIPGPVNCNGDLVAVSFDLLYNDILNGIPHTYAWSTTDGNIVSGATSSEINVDAPGNYCLIITIPGNGCTSQSCITIDGAETPTLELIASSPICFGDTGGSIQSNVSGGTAPYTYLWSNGATTADIFGLGAGTYSLTVTDANQCNTEVSATLNGPTALQVTLTTLDETLAGANDGSIMSTVTGGTPPYNYLWSNGAMTAGINNLVPGNFNLTVTDANGCTFETQGTVASFGCNLDFELIATDVTCFGDSDGSIDLNIISGLSPYQFFWSTGASTEDLENLTPGIYSVSVFDAGNCEQLGSVTIGQPEELTGTIELDGELDCLNESVGINATAQGGIAPYIYCWNDGQQNQTIVVSEAGTYSCTIKDANGCNIELVAIVSSNIEYPLGVECLQDSVICDFKNGDVFGNIYNLGAGFTYEWNGPNGFTSNGESLAWQNLDCGAYTLFITNIETGCYSKVPYHFVCQEEILHEVQIPENVELNCFNNAMVLIQPSVFPIEEEKFEWKDPNGTIVASGDLFTTNPDLEVTECGVYTFTIYSSAYSCPFDFDVNVSCNFEEPIADAGEDQSLDCGQTGLLIGGMNTSSGADIVYTWTDAAGNEVGNQSVIEIDQCGEFTLIVTDLNNGCTALDMVIVSCQQEPPLANAGEDQILNCNTLTAIVGSSESSTAANIIYSWTDSNGNVVGNEIFLTIAACDIYTLTVTNITNGCIASDQVEVLCELDPPIADAGDDLVLPNNCTEPDANFPLTLDGSGSEVSPNTTYLWTSQDGQIISGENTLMPVVGLPGTYTLVVTNEETGCTNSAEILIIIDNGEFPIAIAEIDNSIFDCERTFLVGTGSSVGDQFEYTWTDQNGNIISTELIASDSGFGIYTLTVLDTQTDCKATASVTSTDPSFTSTAIIVDAEDIDSGSIDLTVIGGTAPYTFLWSNGASTEDIEQLAPGEYTVTINDSIGCEHVETFLVDFIEAIKLIDENSLIKIYPNPSTGLVNIELGTEGFELQIIDLMGKYVYSKNQLNKQEVLHLNLNTGVYFIKLKKKDHGQYIAKLILQKE